MEHGAAKTQILTCARKKYDFYLSGVEPEMTVQRRAKVARQQMLIEKGLAKPKKPVGGNIRIKF